MADKTTTSQNSDGIKREICGNLKRSRDDSATNNASNTATRTEEPVRMEHLKGSEKSSGNEGKHNNSEDDMGNLSASKKQRTDDRNSTISTSTSTASPNTANITMNKNNHIIDIPKAINLKVGIKIQVQWDIHHDDLVNSKVEHRTLTRWWGAILLPHEDGRFHILQDADSNEDASSTTKSNKDNIPHSNPQSEPQSDVKQTIQPEQQQQGKGKEEVETVKVPIRTLDYDPYPEGGFLERSLEDVCFLSDHSILNLDSNSRAYWRIDGDKWEPTLSMDEEEEHLMATTSNFHGEKKEEGDDDLPIDNTSPEAGLRQVLDSILQISLQKSGLLSKMHALPRSQQCVIADRISGAKEKLATKLLEQVRGSNGDGESIENVITPEHVRKCMEELGQELNM